MSFLSISINLSPQHDSLSLLHEPTLWLLVAAMMGTLALSRKQKRKMRWMMRLAKWQAFLSTLKKGKGGSPSKGKSLLIVVLILAITLGLGIFVSWLAALIALVVLLCILALNLGKTSR